jgi:hypothetical protein
MVGDAPLNVVVRWSRWLVSALGVLALPAVASGGLVVEGACRDGEPNGAYLLRGDDGRLRVAGAFAKGRRTGTFVFWSERGARVAVVPYDVERKSGTIALWYTPPAPRADPARKSEATYVEDRLHGEKRSWHPSGNPKAVFRYERGELVAARAWGETGAPLPEADAREMAARDLVTDEQFYATLEALVSDHRPKCE